MTLPDNAPNAETNETPFVKSDPVHTFSERKGVSAQSDTAPPSSRPISSRAVFLLVVINLLWGASSAAAKACLDVWGPFSLTVLRFAPAGLVLFLFAAKRGEKVSIARRDRPILFTLGLVGIALTYAIFYVGMERTSAADSSLLFACEPILIALIARIFLRERLTQSQWAGLLVGLVGIWVIAGQAWGNTIALIGLAIESSTSILGKRLSGRYPGLLIAAWEMLIGASLLLPFALFEISRHLPAPTMASIFGLLYLSLICSALGYGIWYALLSSYPVSSMGVFILLQPLVGPVFGVLLRHEHLQAGSALGGMLVMVGVALTILRPKRSAL